MNEQLDQDVVNLAKAIRQVESQNNPTARGASGEFGSYQFLPQTWASSSQKYLGRTTPIERATPQEQNEVAYRQIKEWKDAGYNPGQIASMWNAGGNKPNAYIEGHKGVNSKGVAYDTAEYARKVAETYQSVKGNPIAQQPQATQGHSQTVFTPPEPVVAEPPKTLGERVMGAGQAVSNFFGGKGVTDLIGGKLAQANLPEEQKQFVDLPTSKQVAGSALQLGTLALPVGSMARGLSLGAKGLGLGEKAATAVGTYGSGAVAGGTFGAGQAIQEGQGLGEGLKTVAENAAFGAAAPAVIDTLGYGARAIGTSRAKNAISNLEKGYIEAFSGTKTGLKGVAKSARAGHDDAKFLSNKGITLELTDGGSKYSTDTARQALQADMDTLDDVLTKSLKEVRASIQLDKLEADALKKVDNKFTQAEGTVGYRKEQVKKIFKEYRKIYGDFVGADTLNEIKRGQRRLSGVFDASRPHFASDVHYQIGDVAKKAVEDAAKGAGLPEVKEFNRYYSQHLNAFKALEKLHGNAVKGGKMGKYLTRHVAGLAGAMAGTVSHGPLGTLVGLIAGEAAGAGASRMFAKSRVANPLRDAILERLQKEDPEAVKAVLAYLNRDASTAKNTSMKEAIAPMVTGKMAPSSGTTRGLVDKNILPGDLLLGQKGRSAVEGYISNFVQKPRLGLQLEDVSRKKGVVGAPKDNAFKGFNDLSTKLLEKLKGRTTVSRQFIEDLTNSPDLKQAEKDLIRRVLQEDDDAGDYLYHGTSKSAFENIAKEGIVPQRRGVSSFSKTEDYSKNWAFPEATGTKGEMLRIKASYLDGKTVNVIGKRPSSDELNEILTKETIPPEAIEIKRNGKWEPLVYGSKSDQINVPAFAEKVKSELLPLKRMLPKSIRQDSGDFRYENITLPDELRGPVYNYSEHIYESPIKTGAGDSHFGGETDKYYAHSRIEDLANQFGKDGQPDAEGTTRRVIEIQSDLFQKGRLEGELMDRSALKTRDGGNGIKLSDGVDESILAKRAQEVAKLEPYRNTWHERVIREEVKQAAKDGKTKLQFPTGETAMKIEGLGIPEGDRFQIPGKETKPGFRQNLGNLTKEQLKPGMEIMDNVVTYGNTIGEGNSWIITDVLGDGKFKAVPKEVMAPWLVRNIDTDTAVYVGTDRDAALSALERAKERGMNVELAKNEPSDLEETFDISGKVDTENPIYKFYDKTVAKYLTNKYGGKIITDPQGVKWVEIDVKPEYKKLPVEAFGIAGLIPLAGAQKENE